LDSINEFEFVTFGDIKSSLKYLRINLSMTPCQILAVVMSLLLNLTGTI